MEMARRKGKSGGVGEPSALAVRLRQAIGGRSKSAVARTAGIAPQLLDAYLRDSAPSAERLARLALTLGVRLDWLVSGQEPMLAETALQAAFGRDEIVLVPIFDAAESAFAWRPDGVPVARLELPLEAVRSQLKTTPEALVAVPVSGRAMAPMYRDGDLALIDRGRTELPPAGGYFLLRTPAGLVIRHARMEGQRLVLSSVNEAEFPPERLGTAEALRVQVLGRVAGTQPDPRRARLDPAP